MVESWSFAHMLGFVICSPDGRRLTRFCFLAIVSSVAKNIHAKVFCEHVFIPFGCMCPGVGLGHMVMLPWIFGEVADLFSKVVVPFYHASSSE